MAKLADVDAQIRLLGKFGAVAAVVLVVIFLFIFGGQFVKNTFFPTPPPPPAEKFGALPPVAFPPQDLGDLTYAISTLTGELPTLADRMKVNRLKEEPASLVALNNTRRELANAGYDQNETKLSDSIYQWTSSIDNTTIQFDVKNKNFKISSDYLSQPTSPLSEYISSKDGAYSTTIDLLSALGEDTQNISEEKTTVRYLKNEGGTLVPAASQSEAQYVRVDLFQKNLNEQPVYYPGFSDSLMYFIYKTGEGGTRVGEASYTSTVPADSSEYPIVSTSEAFERLKNGEGYIFPESKTGNVDITDISLGYYIGENQQYFLPIIVFSGKDFTAYVNALTQ